jgi:hypothetical protein
MKSYLKLAASPLITPSLCTPQPVATTVPMLEYNYSRRDSTGREELWSSGVQVMSRWPPGRHRKAKRAEGPQGEDEASANDECAQRRGTCAKLGMSLMLSASSEMVSNMCDKGTRKKYMPCANNMGDPRVVIK